MARNNYPNNFSTPLRGRCAENALAERVNGILKMEHGLDGCFQTKGLLRQAVDQAVSLYSHRRPHTALGNRFTAVVHASSSPLHPPLAPEPRLAGSRALRIRYLSTLRRQLRKEQAARRVRPLQDNGAANRRT
jgi:transposase InsO family protein